MASHRGENVCRDHFSVKAEGSAESSFLLGLAPDCPATVCLLFSLQNLPALVLKIMSGTFAPISDRYSPDLRQLILSMLNLDPSKRPQLNEIMAQAICIRPLLNLYTDVGSVKMRRQVTLPPQCPLGGAATARSMADQLTASFLSSKGSIFPLQLSRAAYVQLLLAELGPGAQSQAGAMAGVGLSSQ